jgi:hypothetical protein
VHVGGDGNEQVILGGYGHGQFLGDSNKSRKKMGSMLTPAMTKMNLHHWYAAQMIQTTKMNHLTPHAALAKKPTLMMKTIHPYLWLLDYLLSWKLEELY